MRILFLTAHLPFPPLSGGRRREFELISRLSRRFEVHLCTVTKTWEMDNIHVSDMLHYCSTVNLFRAVPLDMKQDKRYSLQMKKHSSHEARSHLSRVLKTNDFDVVHVEGYYLMQLLPSVLHVPVLLVEHNIEYLLILQRFMLARSAQERSRFWQEYVYTLKWERLFWKRAKVCVTLTVDDQIAMEKLESSIKVKVIPDGVDHLRRNDALKLSENAGKNHTARAKGSCVLFVGNFAYEPNIDAALYFSNIIFPLVLQDVPNAKLYIVGNHPPPQILSLRSSRGIEVTGYVDSVIPYYEMADVVVCPLRIGGGIKVKVLEALNAGKAIVSTSIGAQGLNHKGCQAIAVADDVPHFAQSVVRLLKDPVQRIKQEHEALAYANKLSTWDNASHAFVRCYREMSSNRNKTKIS
jgi:glycosyltransferase involved in cell wall biosynthesis